MFFSHVIVFQMSIKVLNFNIWVFFMFFVFICTELKQWIPELLPRGGFWSLIIFRVFVRLSWDLVQRFFRVITFKTPNIGAPEKVCAYTRHKMMSTQQAQKSNFSHDVPFVCHMRANHLVTYIWIRFEKYGQFPVEWAP